MPAASRFHKQGVRGMTRAGVQLSPEIGRDGWGDGGTRELLNLELALAGMRVLVKGGGLWEEETRRSTGR